MGQKKRIRTLRRLVRSDGVRVSRRVYTRSHRRDALQATESISKRSPEIRLNAICPYYTMFPLDFPLSCLSHAGATEWVLDPFCGRGTTLFAARLRGLPCVGIDSNPVAAAVAAAKLVAVKAEEVVAEADSILRSSGPEIRVPRGEFWELCYHPTTLLNICRIRAQLLRSCDRPAEIMLRALVLGILHGPRAKGSPSYLSNQMPRTYATKPAAAVRFWQHAETEPPASVDVLAVISKRARHVLEEAPPSFGGAVYLGDARQAHLLLPTTRRFAWVITSPPYFGLRTYKPDQWIRNWFLGGVPDVDYSQDGQLCHHVGEFAEELAKVWRSVRRRCLPEARLIVRFGYLPSMPTDPREVLRESLQRANVGWRIYRWADAGSSNDGKRQAHQFGRLASEAVRELDMYARLE